MCQAPITVMIRGVATPISCRKCKQCKDNYRRDWVGRCIAENQDAVGTTFVTLTYGDTDRIGGAENDLASKVLIYSDIQKWLKSWREGYVVNGVRRKFPLRYFLAGEKGEVKGRCHWHVICFWQKNIPNYMPDVRNWDDRFWPHGFTMWQEFTPRSASYVCKYVQKESGAGELHMSRNPPLGHRYFMRLAAKYVKQGILPKAATYRFPEVLVPSTGKPREFMMRGVTLDNFCSEFIRLWEETYGAHPLDVQHSDFLQEWCDSVAPRVRSTELERRKYVPAPKVLPHFAYKIRYDERRNGYVAEGNGECLYWEIDTKGEYKWQSAEEIEATSARLRAEFEAHREAVAYRLARDGAA